MGNTMGTDPASSNAQAAMVVPPARAGNLYVAHSRAILPLPVKQLAKHQTPSRCKRKSKGEGREVENGLRTSRGLLTQYYKGFKARSSRRRIVLSMPRVSARLFGCATGQTTLTREKPGDLRQMGSEPYRTAYLRPARRIPWQY